MDVSWVVDAFENSEFTTQKELAEAAGITQPALSRILKTKRCWPSTAEKLKKALDSAEEEEEVQEEAQEVVEKEDGYEKVKATAEEYQGSLEFLLKQAEAYGAGKYEIVKGTYVAQIGIRDHNDYFLVAATVGYSQPDWRLKAQVLCDKFNENIGADTD